MWQTEQRALLVGGALVLTAYSTTLAVAHGLWLPQVLPAGLANTLPTLLFGAIAYWINVRFITRQPAGVQAAAHVALAGGFALLSYWMLLVLLGLVNGASPTQFEVRPMISRAMAWQMLQNVTTYAVIALFAYLQRQSRRETPVSVDGPAPNASPLARYFIRSGDEIVPVDVDAIISINGAGDYAEVATANGRHLARMTLAGFERALDPTRFARVHRSHIVNLQCIRSAETAGDGRLLLHLSNGEEVVTSRAGATLLRERVF